MRDFSAVIVFGWQRGDTQVAHSAIVEEYSAFLHFPETIALWDEWANKLIGKSTDWQEVIFPNFRCILVLGKVRNSSADFWVFKVTHSGAPIQC